MSALKSLGLACALAVVLPVGAQTAGSADALQPSELFDWAERSFPGMFPAGPSNQILGIYTVRSYATGNHLGTANGRVYALGPATNQALLDLGPIGNFTCQVRPQATGCAGASGSPVDVYVGTWTYACYTLGGNYREESNTYTKASDVALNFSQTLREFNNASCSGTPVHSAVHTAQAVYEGTKTANGQTVSKFVMTGNGFSFRGLVAVIDGKLYRSKGSGETAVEADGYPAQLEPIGGIKAGS